MPASQTDFSTLETLLGVSLNHVSDIGPALYHGVKQSVLRTVRFKDNFERVISALYSVKTTYGGTHAIIAFVGDSYV